jgi:diguanylate cyclase (GGDEF)-like protein
VAKLLANAAHRPTDLVARFGGEEFVLVMPHTPLAGALEVVDNIRESLNALALPHGASQVCPFVTLSFGVAELPGEETATPEQLLKLTDDALYQAKQQGRNRVVGVRWR